MHCSGPVSQTWSGCVSFRVFTYLKSVLQKCSVCLHPVLSLIRPVPSIQWIRKDGVLSKSRTSTDSYNRVLRFKNISESDGGEYQCTATNLQGMISHTYSVTVEGTVCFTLPDHFLCRFRCGVWTWGKMTKKTLKLHFADERNNLSQDLHC